MSGVPQSRFVPIAPELLETVRTWRNQPRIRNNMLSSNEISEAEQQQWYTGLQGDASRRYFVFLQNETPAGMLYFTDISETQCRFGYYLGVDNVWLGSGLLLEISAMLYAFRFLNVKKLVADVFEFNAAAINIHVFFDFNRDNSGSTVCEKDGVPVKLLKFTKTKDDWIKSYGDSLAKLPRQIREAAQNITFADWES